MKTFVVLLAIGFTWVASAQSCKNNPKIIGACYTVHARATEGADTVRIYLWPVGSKRMLGVTGGPTLDDAVAPIFPINLRIDPGEQVYGDFEVCPFTPERKGHLQLVCVESASHLRAVDRK
jgi:hypothetical protein